MNQYNDDIIIDPETFTVGNIPIEKEEIAKDNMSIKEEYLDFISNSYVIFVSGSLAMIYDIVSLIDVYKGNTNGLKELGIAGLLSTPALLSLPHLIRKFTNYRNNLESKVEGEQK